MVEVSIVKEFNCSDFLFTGFRSWCWAPKRARTSAAVATGPDSVKLIIAIYEQCPARGFEEFKAYDSQAFCCFKGDAGISIWPIYF